MVGAPNLATGRGRRDSDFVRNHQNHHHVYSNHHHHHHHHHDSVSMIETLDHLRFWRDVKPKRPESLLLLPPFLFLLISSCNINIWHFVSLHHLDNSMLIFAMFITFFISIHHNTFHVTWHRAPGTWHLAHHQNLASGVSLKRAFKMQFRNAYFRSLVHSSQKLWPKPD